jgi:hypothetical protein
MLNKIVNGVEVQCTAEEETSIRAEWANSKTKEPIKSLVALQIAQLQAQLDELKGAP